MAKRRVENSFVFLSFFLPPSPTDRTGVLTRPCGRQSRDRPRRDFELGCSRSTRERRRTWPRWGNRSDFSSLSRTDRRTIPCSDRSRNRRTSGERFAVSPPEGSHLFFFFEDSRKRERRETRGSVYIVRVYRRHLFVVSTFEG